MGICCADHVTHLYPQKLALASPIGGGRSVGIVRSRTKATEFFLCSLIFLLDLYSLPSIVRVVKSRRMRWAGHVARMADDRGVHWVLVGKTEGKRPLGRPRRRWEDNIKMDLQEVGGGLVDWMELAQDRDGWRALVGTVRNFRVP